MDGVGQFLFQQLGHVTCNRLVGICGFVYVRKFILGSYQHGLLPLLFLNRSVTLTCLMKYDGAHARMDKRHQHWNLVEIDWTAGDATACGARATCISTSISIL